MAETEYQRAVAAAKAGDPGPWAAWIAKHEKYDAEPSNGVDVTESSSLGDLSREILWTEGLSPVVRRALMAAVRRHHGPK